MHYFHWVLSMILFDIDTARRIGSINNCAFTYDAPIISSVATVNNALSCDACLCDAFKSSSSYVAVNCYSDNHTCSLFTTSARLTGIVSSPNDSLYILSYVSLTFAAEETSTTGPSTAATAASTVSATSSAPNPTSTTTGRTILATNTSANLCYLDPILGRVICLN